MVSSKKVDNILPSYQKKKILELNGYPDHFEIYTWDWQTLDFVLC